MNAAASCNTRLATLLQTVQQRPQSADAWAEIASLMDRSNSAVRDPKQLSEAYTHLVYMGHQASMEAAKRFARTTHDVPLGVALLNAGHTSVLPWLARGLEHEMRAESQHSDVLLDALRKYALTNHDAKLMCDLVRQEPTAVHALYVMLEDYKAASSRTDVQTRRWPGIKAAVEELLHDWMQADNPETPALLSALSAAAPEDYVPVEVAEEIVQCVLHENFAKARKLAVAYAPQLLAVAGSVVQGPVGVGASIAAAMLSSGTVDGAVDAGKAHLDAAYAALRKNNAALAAKVEDAAKKLHIKLYKGGMFACFGSGGAVDPAKSASSDADGAKAPDQAAGAAGVATPVPQEATPKQ